MKRYSHPRDLPPDWFERWQERAAIVQEGCRLPTDHDGTAEANRRAFEMVVREMAAAEMVQRRGLYQ